MISSRSLSLLLALYAIAILLVAPRATYADSQDSPPTAAVRFADLDLHTHPGVATLYRRIQTAAVEVCRQTEPQGTLLASGAHRACLHQATFKAVQAVKSASLTAYYAERDDQVMQQLRLLNTVSR